MQLPEQFTRTVGDWQERLLQLDRRNRLLYLNTESKSIVAIGPDSPALHKSRVGDGASVSDSIAALLDKDGGRGASFDYAERVKGSAQTLFTRGDLQSDCEPIELQRRLGRLRKRQREWQEEQGLPILYLALGLLRWVDAGGDASAPLLLLPCDLTRASQRSEFRLASTDDDFERNDTLGVQLNKLFNLTLPNVADAASPSGYFESVRQAINGQQGWSVEDKVYLGAFAYSKLAMWRDLEALKTRGTDNEIVKVLSGLSTPQPSTATLSAIPANADELAGGKLDDLLDLKDQFTVLDADYSQLTAVAHARNGLNLVIHGPPGTGKSQTIANIISTFIAEEKSVLFVSEKTAALDVVKKRLDEAALGVYCLDLHSDRGRKANVYAQLKESVEAPRPVRKKGRKLPALIAQRRKLNEATRALHAPQPPLNMSIHQVHGQYAALGGSPRLSLSLPFTITTMDQDWIAKMRNALNQIAQRSREYEQHGRSHWAVLLVDTPALDLPDKVRESMEDIRETALRVVERLSNGARFLGLAEPNSIERSRSLSLLLAHMKEAPGVFDHWLSAGALASLSEAVREEKKTQQDREVAIAALRKAWESIPDWDFDDLLQRVTLPGNDCAAIEAVIGKQWRKQLMINTSELVANATNAATAANTAWDVFKAVQGIFASTFACDRSSIQELIDVAHQTSAIAPVPASWITGDTDIGAMIDKAKEQASALIAAEKALTAKYDLQIINEVDREMLARYRTDHQSVVRRLLSGQFRKDQKVLQGHRVTPAKLSAQEGLALVQQIVNLHAAQGDWDIQSAKYQASLGHRFRGKDTDWAMLEQAFSSAQDMVARWPGTAQMLHSLLVDGEGVSELMERERRLSEKANALDNAMRLIAGDALWSAYETGKISIEEAAASLKTIIPILERIAPIIIQVVQKSLTHPNSINDIIEQIQIASRLRKIEHDAAQRESELVKKFEGKYSGFDTNWSKINADLQWAVTFLQYAPDDPSNRLREHALSPYNADAYAEHAAQFAQAEGEFHGLKSRYAGFYDLDAGPWDSWTNAPYDEIIIWTTRIEMDADNASDWILYRNAVADSEGLLGSGAIDKCREITSDAGIVPRMVERSILSKWLEAIYEKTPELRAFASVDHEETRKNFREIDQQFPIAIRSEIREKMFQVYASNQRSYGMRTLSNELTKKRRQKSVRSLVQAIPDCIKAFKPCFMMSPLAVSRYLSHEDATPSRSQPILPLTFKAAFDVVIFDEASQVFPWDAIPALLHAKQAIFAGDPKQLPPSVFWRQSGDDDDYDDDDDDDVAENGERDALKDRESILDVAVNQRHTLFHDSRLDMHYRSRHEDLIRFSNYHFYAERLLTFPTPGVRDEWHGVHRHFLPEARYEGGGRRINLDEAERVVELVVEHLRTHPTKSLGVAAMSRPQADLIERLIEERLLDERDAQDVRQRMSEPLFVKNLENVQGDERDRIIISIGYGPTAPNGATPNNFGPLNRKGGDRRLNVLVTRARERMDIVHSIEPARITSQSDGARLLRRFLEYVANPRADLGDGPSTAQAQPTGIELNDFEKAVQDALIAKGHRVVGQVGSAGYRIDLAILSKDGAKYDLGVECDGATYHSAPAARDRDWLRQSVLEGLGWTIHRVWSTSWVRNPGAEIERIEEALSRARSYTPPTPPPSGEASVEISDSTADEDEGSPAGIVADIHPHALAPYYETDLSEFVTVGELRYASVKSLVGMAVAVAKVEGPVHADIVIERIRKRYGIARVRGSTREHVKHALEQAVKEKRIRSEGGFLYAKQSQLSREPRSLSDSNIDYAPPSELKTLIIRVADAFRGPRDGLVTEISRTLEFARTGARIVERLNELIDALLSEGRLEESGGIIRAPRA